MTELTWTTQAVYPPLLGLLLLPLLAAGLVIALRKSTAMFPVAVAAALAEIIIAFRLYQGYDTSNAALQFAERLAWLGWHSAVDGIGILFIVLTAVLTLMVVLYGRVRPLEPQPVFLAVVFVTEATLMGLFSTLNLLWFFAFTALQLGVLGYLLWRWATSPVKALALTRFWQFMGVGLVLLAGGIIMLGWNYADAHGGRWSFDLLELSQIPVQSALQSAVFFLLFLGLAIRIPLFPLHGWLPLTAEHGSVAVAPVFLLGLKTGIYGLLRFVFPLVPEAVTRWQPFVIAFAVVGVFYAALLATQQTNLRRLLAFAVISHTGILVIGLFTLDAVALQGAVLLSANFGLAGAGLVLMTGLVFRRTGTASLPALGGLFDRIPLIGIAFFVAGLAIVGMPGTPGFDAVHLVLEAAIHRFGALVTIAAALGNVVAAGFLLWAFQRAFLAQATNRETQPEVERANGIEWLLAISFIVMMPVVGFYFTPWMELTEHSVRAVSAVFVVTPGIH